MEGALGIMLDDALVNASGAKRVGSFHPWDGLGLAELARVQDLRRRPEGETSEDGDDCTDDEEED